MSSLSSRRWGRWILALGLAVMLVLPAAALAAPVTIDDTDPAFSYFTIINTPADIAPYPGPATWMTFADGGMSGGSNHFSGTLGAYAEVTFEGTAVTLKSTKGPNRGDADIYLDGIWQATVSEFYNGPLGVQYGQTIWSKSGLAAGTHTLRVTCAATGAPPWNYVEIDAIEVEPVPAAVSTPASAWWSIALLAIAALGVVGIAKRNLAR